MRRSDSVKISRGFSHTFSSTPVVRSLFNENVPKIRPYMIFSRFPGLSELRCNNGLQFGDEPIPPNPKTPSVKQSQAIEIRKDNGVRSSASQLRENYFLRNDGAKIIIDVNFGMDVWEIRQKYNENKRLAFVTIDSPQRH